MQLKLGEGRDWGNESHSLPRMVQSPLRTPRPLVREPQEVYEPLDSPAWPKPHRSQFPSGRKNPKVFLPQRECFYVCESSAVTWILMLRAIALECCYPISRPLQRPVWQLILWGLSGLIRETPWTQHCGKYSCMSMCVGQPLWFWGVNSCRTPSPVWASCTIPLGTGPSLYADGILVAPSLAQNPLLSPALTQHWPRVR